jgi:hypothetical protein
VSLTAARTAVCTFANDLDLWFASEKFASLDQVRKKEEKKFFFDFFFFFKNFLIVRCNYVHALTNNISVYDSKGVRFPHLVEKCFSQYDDRKMAPATKIVENVTVTSTINVDFKEERAGA